MAYQKYPASELLSQSLHFSSPEGVGAEGGWWWLAEVSASELAAPCGRLAEVPPAPLEPLGPGAQRHPGEGHHGVPGPQRGAHPGEAVRRGCHCGER